ncbi:MAG: phosphate ABC transporter substrate-binding protein [Asgard group archaeon]|nr:phosphate ABC transporter substrate-binding protein [Asgard group archaeon]
MSFGSSNRVLTIILIILIPVAAGTGVLITWATMQDVRITTLNVEGSTTVFKIVEDSAVAFADDHPGVEVTVAGTGSGPGITALIDGQCDVAMASRPVKAEENTTAGGTLKAYAIAGDGIAIIVHDNVGTLDFNMSAARGIFNGTYTSWADFGVTGLSSDAIQVVARETGSGTRDTFSSIVLGDEDAEYADGAILKASDSLILEAVKDNDNYIGYVGLGYVEAGVEACSIDGVTPSEETVADESYAIARQLFLVIDGEPTGLAWEFINWHLSPIGQDWVVEGGFVAIYKRASKL